MEQIAHISRASPFGAYCQRRVEQRISGQFTEKLNCVEQIGLASAVGSGRTRKRAKTCLLYTSDAADERSSVDLGGRRIIKKKKRDKEQVVMRTSTHNTSYKRTAD